MRIIVAALAGAIVVFIVSAVFRMATPLGTAGLTVIADEDPVLERFRASLPRSGIYFFPSAGMDFKSKPTPEQQKAWEEKLRRGPRGLIVYTAEGSEALSPRQLVSEFVANFLAAAVAAVLLSVMVAPYLARAVFVGLLPLFGFLSVAASHWIWYGFPTSFVVAELAMEFVAWLLAGFAMAKIVKFRSAAA
jgi:hypothetical protein